jgi:hypothetical protein
MDSFHKHILTRLDNLEAELSELRTVTWPVCQGIIDEKTGPLDNIPQKRRFFRFIHLDDIRNLLRTKARFMGISPSLVVAELQQVLVEVPRVDA